MTAKLSRPSRRGLRRLSGGAAAAVTGSLLLQLFSPVNPASAAPTGTGSVVRVQVRIDTGDVSDAGTDDPVYVSLNGSNLTWLDSPTEDWNRGSSRTYDLMLDGVSNIASLNQLRVGKAAPVTVAGVTINADAWCLARVSLLVNNVLIFDQPLPRVVATDQCRWLKGSYPSFTWSSAEIRANKQWIASATPPVPVLITKAALRSQAIAAVGQQLHADPRMRWSSSPYIPGVTVTRVDDHAVHVDLDLFARVPWFSDVPVDIDFDLRFACVVPRYDPHTNTTPPPYYTVTRQNLTYQADSGLGWDIMTLGLVQALDSYVTVQIGKGLDTLPVQTIIGADGGCRQPYVRYNGDLSFLGF